MKIKLMFGGDFCAKDPTNIKFSESLSSLMKTCQVKGINFEAPLSRGRSCSPNNINLKQSENSPSWLERQKFNLISLANNHMLDYGEEGLLATKNSFKKATTVGAGTWGEAYAIKFIIVEGVKIGFFSATSSDFSSLSDNWTECDQIGCAWINQMNVNNIISAAKKECEYLIILSHGGIEFMDVPLPEWRNRYRELVNMGADAIIASHPHVPQGVEEYKGKPIFYSLGNFFFDYENMKKPRFWDNGILAILEIQGGQINYEVIPIIKSDNLLDIDRSRTYNQHLFNISEILKDEDKYLQKVNEDVLKLSCKYQEWLLAGLNAVEMRLKIRNLYFLVRAILLSKPNYKVTLHQIRDESTRWLLVRALKLRAEKEN